MKSLLREDEGVVSHGGFQSLIQTTSPPQKPLDIDPF